MWDEGGLHPDDAQIERPMKDRSCGAAAAGDLLHHLLRQAGAIARIFRRRTDCRWVSTHSNGLAPHRQVGLELAGFARMMPGWMASHITPNAPPDTTEMASCDVVC